jgi:hypothetical protein
MMRSGAALAMVAGLLASCAGEPPYFGPLGPDHETGYGDTRIAPTLYRVTFRGDDRTPADMVENFLVLHGAQVALQAGYPYFVLVMRNTSATTTFRYTPTGPAGGGVFGWWSTSLSPPFGITGTANPVRRYEAFADIELMTADEGRSDPQALDAHVVLDRAGRAVPPAVPQQ